MNWKMVFAAILLIGLVERAPASPIEVPVERTREMRTAMDFLAALGRLDFDAAALFLDEDAVLDLPFAGKGLTLKGREPILQFFRKSMTASVGAISYTLEKAYPSHEAGALVMELSTQGRTKTGADYRNRLVTIFMFHRGKITLFREYFNPVPVAR